MSDRHWPGYEQRGHKYYNPKENKKGGYSPSGRPKTDVFSIFLYATFFIVATVGTLVGVIVLVGWGRLVVFGDYTSAEYFRRVGYDLLHLNEASSWRSLQYLFEQSLQ